MDSHVRLITMKLLLLAWILGGCQSLAKIPRSPQEALGLAEGLIKTGENDEAIATLEADTSGAPPDISGALNE